MPSRILTATVLWCWAFTREGTVKQGPLLKAPRVGRDMDITREEKGPKKG